MFGSHTHKVFTAIAAFALAAIICLAQSTTPPATTAPAKTTTALTKTVTPDTGAPAEAKPLMLRFQFKKETYRDVIRFMARAADKPVLGNIDAVQGHLTYFDAKPYTYVEAMGIVNEVLRTANFSLVDKGRYLKIISLKEMPQHSKILRGLDEAKLMLGDEIITTILPLRFIDAEQAVNLVVQMVPQYGTIHKLGTGEGIVITSSVANIRRIQRMLSTIDRGELAKQQLKYYSVKHAPAASLAALVEQLFGAAAQGKKYAYDPKSRRYKAVPADPSQAVTVTSDARANMIIVMGSAEKHKLVAELIAKMDVDQPSEGAVRIIQLQNANAVDLAKIISAAIPHKTIKVKDAKGRVKTQTVSIAKIVPDPGTNRLLVSATPDLMKQIEEMVKKLDDAPVIAGVQLFPLKVANATALVEIVRSAFAKRDSKGKTIYTFSVTADARTNTLIVNGPASEMQGVTKLLEALDVDDGGGGGGREVHIVRLAVGDAREVASALKKVLLRKTDPRSRTQDDSIRIEADRSSNSLIIACGPGDWQTIEKILETLAQQEKQVLPVTRIFPLKHAKATEAAQVITRVFDPRRRGRRRNQPEPIPVIVAPDTQSNSLVISAAAADLDEINKMIVLIDIPQGDATKVEVRSYPLAYASASEVARALTKLFATSSRDRGKAAEPQPRFEAETNSNTLMVAATAKQFEDIEPLILHRKLAADDARTLVKIFPLKHAKATDVAKSLQQVVAVDIAAAQRRSASRHSRRDFQVSADERTNSLVVSAPAVTMAIIEELVPKLDAAGTLVQVTRVIELENADAREVANAINAALTGQGGRDRRGRPTSSVSLTGLAGRKVIVVPEPSARAVLLTGTEEDVAFAEKLIKQIDARPSVAKEIVETFKLEHGKAEDIAAVLSATVAKTGRGGSTRVSAEKNANAIVVSAPGDVIERIRELLKDLDVPGATDDAVTIKVIKLTNAKAEQLAEALNSAQGIEAGRRGSRGGSEGKDETVRVTADTASNSLLLTGRPTQIKETVALIEQLDKPGVQLTAVTRIFALKHAKAADIVPVLESILRQQTTSRRRSSRRTTPVSTGPEVRIAAQDKANAIVVQGPPEAIALAEEIIKKFDSEDAGGAATVIEVVKLSKAEAVSLAVAINQALAAEAKGGGRSPATEPGAVVVAETNSNSLLVRGNKIDVAKAVLLIKQLDVGEGVGVQVRVFPLDHAEAPLVAKTIDTLFRQITTQQRRNRARNAPPPAAFSVTSDERTNSVIVSTSTANFTIVETLLTSLDKEGAPGDGIQYITLLQADPIEMADKIDALFADRNKGDRPIVEPDDFTGSLMIMAKPADLKVIEEMVSRIDGLPADQYVSVRVITISPEVGAQKMAEVLKRVYEKASGTKVQIEDEDAEGSGGELFMLPAFGDDDSKAKADGAPAAKPATDKADEEAAEARQALPIIITVDKESNSLIISASQDDLFEIEMLLEQIAAAGSVTESELEVVKVKLADPVALAKTLNALFAVKQPRQPQPRAPRGGGRNNRGGGNRGGGRQQPARPAAPAKPSVTIVADSRTRSLIIRAKRTEMVMIKKLIEELDKAPGEELTSEVRVFPLKNTDAAEVATNIQQLFKIAGAAPARGARNAANDQALIKQMLEMQAAGGPVDASVSITVSANRATNSVIVTAPKDAMDLIAKLIEEIDQERQDKVQTVKIFKIKHAQIADVVDAVTKILQASQKAGSGRAAPRGARAGAAPRPAVAGSEASRTVIVYAAADELPLIEQVIADLDQASQEDPAIVKVYRLEHSDARATARALSETLLQSVGGRGRRASGGALRISPDTGSNSIVVRGSAAEHEEIAQLILDLDQAPASKAVFRTFKLVRTDAREIASALSRMARSLPVKKGDPTPSVAADRQSNTVMVSGSAAVVEIVAKMIEELEAGEKAPAGVKFYQLRFASAADVASSLNAFYGPQAKAANPADRSVTISINERTNSLMVSAKPDQLVNIATIITKMDVEDSTGAPDVFILPLKNADAQMVADTVGKLYDTQLKNMRRQGKILDPVTITADVRTNSLIVATTAKQYKSVLKLVNQIDEMSPARGKMHVIELKDADPNDVLKAIERLYGSGANGRVGRGGRSGTPKATVLAGQRALLLNDVSADDLEAIKKLVAAMEEAAAKNKYEVLVFPLTNAANSKVAQAINNVYAAAVRPNHPEDRVRATALAGTNAVVVTAAKEKMADVSKLIKELDGARVVGQTEHRIFALTNASAQKVLPILRQMIQPLQQARPNQKINVTVDPRANAIVVSTQAPVMNEIAAMIRQLDSVPPFKAADVIIIPLKNAEAFSLAETLTDILTPGTSKIQTPEAKALQEQVRLLRTLKGKEALPLLDLSKPIKISSDPLRRGRPGSNSLIISSTPENLLAMREIVALLDTLPVTHGVTLKFRILKNADANTVTTLLRQIFAQGRQLAGKPGGPTAGKAEPETLAGAALTNVLNVTADPRTNAIVIAGSEKTVALAMAIVKDLDRQPTSQFTEVRLFKLVHADALALANLIRPVFAEGGAPQPGVEGAKAYVSRLRVLTEKKHPVSSKISRTHPTLTVVAEPNANILIVAARSDLMPIIAEMVKAADVPGAGSMNVVRIYALKNADATRMSALISGLYSGPNRNLIRAEDRPAITVDARTNSLVVSSSDKTFAMIDALLGKLDRKQPIELRDIRLLPLTNADAAVLGATLQQMMDARVQRQTALGVGDADALRMIVIADARSNYLIVGGSAEGFELVKDLAARLDSAAPALSGKIQLIALKNANAGTLSTSLNNLFNQRYAAARTPDVRRQKPVIVPDLRTNLLMVAAGQDDSLVITTLVKQLDARPPSPAVELVVIPLRFNDAGSVGPMIEKLFADLLKARTPVGQQISPQDVVSIATEPLSNSLVVAASKENLVEIRALLKKVDMEPPTDTGVVKIYQLKHTDVQRVTSLLEGLLAKGLYKPGLVGAADNAIAQAREKVAIASDLRTNLLIVSASKENLVVIDKIVSRIDVKEGWGLTGNINVIVLKHADATRLGPALQQMFDRKRQAETATGGQPRSLPVVIFADERTNALLIAASRESFDEITALVTNLDAEDVVRNYDFRVFYLKQASALSLEPTVRQLFAQRVVRGVRTTVTVIADPKSNALIIGASRDDMAMAENLIARLDTAPPKTGQTIAAFPVNNADAQELAAALQKLYDAQKPPGGQTGIAITVDERLNIILVSAAKADMANIAKLVKQLDTAMVTDVTEVRIITLRHADATQLAQILLDALTNKPKAMTAKSENRALLLRLIAKAPNGEELIASAIKEGFMITPVPRTNSLIVQAPVEAVRLLVLLITALDTTDPRVAQIEVFPLTNADAVQTQRVLTELFRLQLSNTQRESARYAMAGGSEDGGVDSAAATLGSAEQTALAITVDRRTNSLLVAGTEEYIKLVGKVIQELDASPAEDRETIVYRLRNAQATDIEAALQSFLDQERTRVAAILGADAVGAAKELLAREIAVVAEQASNRLLISGSPRFFKTIMQMIDELDQRPPQVLVDVLLAEVALDNSTDFGVQWSALGSPGSSNLVASSLFGLKSGSGFSLSVTSGSLDLLFRALQKQGRLEILSRPQLTATDNKLATINIGQRVPFVTDSRVTEGGAIFNTITYEPVGVILDVTPHISPDGFVRLEVRPEISSIADSSVQISEGLSAVIVNSRSAETTVTVQDGHTVVIGGLITTKEQNREEKIPLLGDIPLIGNFFKSTKIVKQRTELLIVLTPHIIRTATDADILTNREIRNLSLTRSVTGGKLVGRLLNPLENVTPAEVKRIEGKSRASKANGNGQVLMPLAPLKPRAPRGITNGESSK